MVDKGSYEHTDGDRNGNHSYDCETLWFRHLSPISLTVFRQVLNFQPDATDTNTRGTRSELIK
jgi:hypothetical protein